MHRLGRLAALGLALIAAAPVAADTVESALSPGKLIQGHAKMEGDCTQCHMRFNKGAQTGLCLDCHKDIAKDVQGHQGYHGLLKEKECRACHTEHKGLNVNIAPLDEKRFDHTQTDFALKGGHAAPKVQCRDCHPVGQKHRDAPSDCVACHKKNDVHKGSLGSRCADCHTETNWKQTRFDHSKTKFPLIGKHIDVMCTPCHTDPHFKGAPTACVACHKKDDDKKGHHGRFGNKCESCHTEKSWNTVLFDHDRNTKYPLRGKHRLAKCESCHIGSLFKDKVQTSCVACHKKDDDSKGHKGRFGDKCQSCHTEKDWRVTTFNHDRDTKYPLRGKHMQAKCDSCHIGNLYRDKVPNTCFACHAKDDKHRGQEGKQCESCHNETAWRKTSFDHGLTHFPLLGKHAAVECKKCHLTQAFKDTKTECVACHVKDDFHKGRLGSRCESCHNAANWKAWRYDHNTQTKFILDGGHKGLHCDACHTRPTDRPVLSSTCSSCHDQDDVHHGNFGRQCERCHTTPSWKVLRSGIGISPR